MAQFRLALIAFFVLILCATVAAVATDGANLLPHFVLPILGLSWQGQFNIDFSLYLVLSGIWVAWRGGFSRGSITLGLLAPPLGMLFFAPYLIYLIGQSGGDPGRLLLGVHSDQGAGISP